MRHGSLKHIINEYPQFVEELDVMDEWSRGPLPGRVVPDGTGIHGGKLYRPNIRTASA